jgi:hypothetical protein
VLQGRKLVHTLCTLIEWEAEEKMSGAFMALANRLACLVSSACSYGGYDANTSYLVPTRIGTAVLLNPLACRYHSLTLLRVAMRDRSNMKRIAAASLQTSGNMLTNSGCLQPHRTKLKS